MFKTKTLIFVLAVFLLAGILAPVALAQQQITAPRAFLFANIFAPAALAQNQTTISISETQIQAILSLLRASGTEQSIIDNVNALLHGQTTGNGNTLTVTVPNGGEEWEQGILHTVTWTPYDNLANPSINPASQVSVYLEKKNSRGQFETVGKLFEEGKASVHTYLHVLDPNGGLVETYPAPGRYYVRVVNDQTGASDRSDASFRILQNPVDIKVNGSDGPLGLSVNERVTLRWSSTGMSSCSIGGVTLIGTSNVSTQTQGTLDGIYLGGYINLSCKKTGTEIWASDYVAVRPEKNDNSLSVLSPNGGQAIDPSQIMNVSFGHSGISSYSAALYKNDQWKYWIEKGRPITNANLTSFSWVPSSAVQGLGSDDNAGSIFKIYILGIKSDGTGSAEDKSDAPFSFTAPSTVTTPPATGTYLGYLDGRLFITTQNVPRTYALENCYTNAINNPAKAVRCTWNGTEIYNNTQPTTPTTSIPPATGTYLGYLDGRLFITTQNVSRVYALENCYTNARNNPTKATRCTWNGTEIYNNTQSTATPPTTGTYQGYLDGRLFITTPNITRAAALANCELNARNNLTKAVRCTWNGTEIYNNTNSPRPQSTTPTTSTTPATGTYQGYLNGALFITTQNITRAAALANCELNAKNNSTKVARCTWSNTEIFNNGGTYRGYVNGALSVSTANVTEAKALQDCRVLAQNNIEKEVRCTWKTKEIFVRPAVQVLPTGVQGVQLY